MKVPTYCLLLAGSVWLAAIAGGFVTIALYERTEGEAAAAGAHSPSESQLATAADRACLVFVAHPRCPCTRASLDALAELVQRGPDRFIAHVLLVQPSQLAEEWSDTDLKARAERIPGVHVQRDVDGREARRFGAATSGQVYLYDAGGRLLFRGGITDARGLTGDSVGVDAITALLSGHARPIVETPVFGCALFDAPTRQEGCELCKP